MSNWPRKMKVTLTFEDNADGTLEVQIHPRFKNFNMPNSDAYRLAVYAYGEAVKKALKNAEKKPS